MKTYVLTVSKNFPTTHPRKGEPTCFMDKINASVICRKRCFGECELCKNYKWLSSQKLHTIRSNYDLWKKRIDKVNEEKAILSLRYWSGKPYNSKQVEFLQLTSKDGIGVQEICFDDHICDWSDTAFIYELVNDNQIYRDIKFSVLSGNDGLSIQDFKDWFKGYDLSEPMAIIHFTKFRY